jgi:F0F1-type ATP synthase assembly protein I
MSDQINNSRPSRPMWQALGLAWELGYTISIPLVILALAGRLADKILGTAPWLLLVGVLISIFISSWLVYRKTINIISGEKNDVEKKEIDNNSTESKL